MRSRLPFPALLASLLLLEAGCAAVGPDFRRPDTPAPPSYADWHGGDAALAAPAQAASAPGRRWADLADPTLSRLLDLAGTDNLDLQAAASRVLQARALEATASAQRGPQVSAMGGASRERLSENGSATRLVGALPGVESGPLRTFLGEPFSLFQTGFDASWELDLWGRVRRDVEAAQAQTRAAQADAAQMRLTIVAELFKSYAQLRALQRQLTEARTSAAAGHEAADLLSAQAAGGLVDDSPLLRQRLQDADLDAQVDALLAQVAAATNRVTLLCGQVPGSLNGLLADDPSAAPPDGPDLRLGLPSTLLRRRPDVQAAEARLAQATAATGVAVADLYPRVTLGASFGFESLRDSQAFDWNSRQWSAGPSLVLPVFDQGRRRATIELRERQQQEAALAYRAAVLKAWHEVDDAISACIAAGRDVATGERRVADARAALALADARRDKGLTDALPVLAATQALAQAGQALAESRGRRQVDVVALYKALGGDASDS